MLGSLITLMLASLTASGAAVESAPTLRALHVTIYVDASATGPGTGTPQDPVPTIADALQLVIPHDYIIVRPGVYNESVDMPFFISITAEAGPDVTFIDATGQPGTHAVTVGTLCEFIGFTVRKADGAGVLMTVPPEAPEAGRKIRGVKILDCPGGGLTLSGPCHPIIGDTVIAGCSAYGLRLEGGASPWFGGNTLSGNGVGIDQVDAPDGTGGIVNNVVYGNTIEFQGIPLVDVMNSCVGEAAYAGSNGNFGADPQFLAPSAHDYRIGAASPCVDAGDENFTFTSGFFDNQGYGHRRKLDGDFDGIETTDVGAHEWGGLQSIITGAPLAQVMSLTIATGPGTDYILAIGAHNTNPGFFPGVTGYLFLNANTIVPALSGSLGPSGSLTLPIPLSIPALLNLEFRIQAIGFDIPGPGARFTNSETIRT